jgi:beta-N-acetylhexosaminidase
VDNTTSAADVQALTAALQQVARRNGVPDLLFAIDQEGGSVERLQEGVTRFGPNAEIGPLAPIDALARVCSQGRTQGHELAALGIQVNLAPVVDVWDNPANTVIGDRAYGDDPAVVARLGSAYIQALQHTGVSAVAKHFPGHGSTVDDSHATLPVDAHDRAWMDSHELVPFRAAMQAGVDAIMVAHVAYPGLDPQPNRPASLSPAIVTDLLRQELGYTGAVVTDDLGAMLAITGRYEAGESAIQAIAAGADLLTVSGTLDRQRRMVAAVTAAVGTRITPEQLDAAVLNVLRLKAKAGLLGQPPAVRDPGVCG